MTARRSRADPRRTSAVEPHAALTARRRLDRAVTAHASHFDRRDAIQAVADSLPDGAPAAEVERIADAFLASESVIRIAESAERRALHHPAHLGA